ncbi:hypothetical protein Q4583_01550 [Neptunomonas phycophila]|uniref:DUF4139 domain-containing protein n=1 Tax=Neptunomonas phycophila TaxID=1572645 RepID=UPI0026E48C0B|nr:hypothetical protein [Neptunomonas phycophila]MDO6782782.1 hypothetical protein [Neptunomonas phycophila]
MRFTSFSGALFLSCLPVFTQAATHLSADQQTQLDVTLYTDNLGLVQETRSRPALPANQPVYLEDISQQMQTETLRLNKVGRIKEQTLNQAVLNLTTLLDNAIGNNIILARRGADGQELQQTVRLLSAQGNTLMIEHNGRIETITRGDEWRIIFPDMPDNLVLKPSLQFTTAGAPNAGEANISYLTAGLSWQMDYVMTLNTARDAMQLQGMASLQNMTGTDFKNARIKLLAGNVNQVQGNGRMYAKEAMMRATMDAPMASAVSEQQSLSDYQLYTLESPVNLLDQQRTQVPFISQEDVSVEPVLTYRFRIGANPEQQTTTLKPNSVIRFYNNQHHGIGKPLPAGNARFFIPDNDGQLQYVGAAHLQQTAIGDRVELPMGQAFDQSIVRKQTDIQEAFDGTVVAYELLLRNNAKESRVFEISTDFYQPWSIVSSTIDPTEKTGGNAVWRVTVPGNAETTLNMRIRLRTEKKQ